MLKKSIYIISGGPGFGKSSLIEKLRIDGYLCADEFARELIEEQIRNNGTILPWKDAGLFQNEILRRRTDFFGAVPENTTAFSDRGIPDQIAFALYNGFKPSARLLRAATNLRYASSVFICPPWAGIYCTEELRKETFAEAVQIDRFIRKTYSDLNYQIIELPLCSVNERIEFILQYIKPI